MVEKEFINYWMINDSLVLHKIQEPFWFIKGRLKLLVQHKIVCYVYLYFLFFKIDNASLEFLTLL